MVLEFVADHKGGTFDYDPQVIELSGEQEIRDIELGIESQENSLNTQWGEEFKEEVRLESLRRCSKGRVDQEAQVLNRTKYYECQTI